MAGDKIKKLQLDIEELNRLSQITARKRVQDILFLESRKLQTQLRTLEAEAAVANENQVPPITCGKPKSYDLKITTYSWYQSDSLIEIYVTLPGVNRLPEQNVKCLFTAKSFSLTVSELDGKNHVLSKPDLLENINPEKSYWKLKKDMVIIFLSKQTASHWNYLTSTDETAKQRPTPKLDKDEENMDSDPGTSFMKMMQKLYSDGDDDMKRTIEKAWVESNTKGRTTTFD